MMQSNTYLNTARARRLVLIADDELINREILGAILKSNYDVIYACDGEETLRQIRKNIDILSLVLLDLRMPVMDGITVLKNMKDAHEMQHIPVIVMTADQEAEVESLSAGAVDFIPKPYPQPKVILARVLRTIELFEDRQTISSTERDPVTGLYHKEYFYRYAEQYDRFNPDTAMDAIVVDIHHFHVINDRFGMSYGDEALRQIGGLLRESVREHDGIVCRREADTFMIYCPSGIDYRELLDHASIDLPAAGSSGNRVRLRMGVYANADKKLDIKQRFDRAKMAADTIRASLTKNIELYDDSLRQKELYTERLVDDFREALETGQFLVYYQPKFNIREEIPSLASAEALVRWKHPELGMISPGIFIPLFEGNGLIQELDQFVWHEAARQIREWKDGLGYTVPVSVNVSRIDLYEPDLTVFLKEILEEYELNPEDLNLEITESAYTSDSKHIVERVTRLRDMGFHIEMDDFGAGYSSLNMISSLPIDALKLDMLFIRNAFKDGRDTRLLEVIIDIAGYLSVPVIAEGVETEDQLLALKAIGCDMVQGYYFSKPVPAEDFVNFLVAQKKRDAKKAFKPAALKISRKFQRKGIAYSSITQALAQDYSAIYYADLETGWFVEYSSRKEYASLGLEKSGDDFFSVSRKNIPRLIAQDDQERLLLLFTRENMEQELEKQTVITLNAKLILGCEAYQINLKIARMSGNGGKHIVMAVSVPELRAG